MKSCSIFILVSLICQSNASTLIEKQSISSHTNQLMKNLIFYKFNKSKLAEFLAEQKLISLLNQRKKEIQMKLKKERERRIRSSFINDFLTTRY